MKKISFLLIACMCVSIISGCGKSASMESSAVETEAATEEESSEAEESTETAETESDTVEEGTETEEKMLPDVDLVELIRSTATIDENSIVFDTPYTVLDDNYVKVQVKSVERELTEEGTTDERYVYSVNVTIENKSEGGELSAGVGVSNYVNDHQVTFINSNVTAGPGEKNEDAAYKYGLYTKSELSNYGSEYIESVEDLLTFYAPLYIELDGEQSCSYMADISLADAIVAVNAPELANKNVITFDTPYMVVDDKNVTVQVKSVERKLVGRGTPVERYVSRVNLVVENKNEDYPVFCSWGYPVTTNGHDVLFNSPSDGTDPGETNENICFYCNYYPDDPRQTTEGAEYIESVEDLLTLEAEMYFDWVDTADGRNVDSNKANISLPEAADNSEEEAADSSELPTEGEIVFDSPYTLLDNDDVTIQAKSVEIAGHNKGTEDEYYEDRINLIIVNKNEDCRLSCNVGIPGYINDHEVNFANSETTMQFGETSDTACYECLVYKDPDRHSSVGSEYIGSVEDLLNFHATVCISVEGARRDCYYADISLAEAAAGR